MTTEQLLQAILDELRALRADLARRNGEPIPERTIGPFLNNSGALYRMPDVAPGEQDQGND